MALVIEDGTGIAGANSYATAEELVAYAALRNKVITAEEAPGLLIDAMDFMSTQCFGGDQMFELPFPRTLWDGIPAGIKTAQLRLALDAKNGVKLNVSSSGELIVKREKVGPIDTEFFAPGDSGVNPNAPNVPIAMAAMYPYSCEANPAPFKFRTFRA